MSSAPLVLFTVIVAGIGGTLILLQIKKQQRLEQINQYRWPPGLMAKLRRHFPELSNQQYSLIDQALRQYFRAYLLGGRRYVSMPSEAADQLWHEFILYTRDYRAFCDAAFGRYLDHTPAVVLTRGEKQSNEGLRRVWWQACREEGINPAKPATLPLLFGLDAKLGITGGYVYHPDCEDLRRAGYATTQCGGDFSSWSFDGGTAGLGDGDGGSGGDSGGDGGGGCGGGD